MLSPDEFERQIKAASDDAAKALEQARQANRQKQIQALTARATIPLRFLEATLTPKTPEQAAVYKIGQEFVAHFDDRLTDGSGLVIIGDIGVGKTHLACAIGNGLVEHMHTVLYCTALEAVLLVKASWQRKQDQDSEFAVYEKFCEPELLIMDEVGVQAGSDFEQMVLTSVIDLRSRNCRPTVIVSNLGLDGVLMLLGQRAFDRLLGFGGCVLEMRGASLRRRPVKVVRG